MYNLTTCRFSLPIFRSTVRSGQLIMNSFTENTLLLESAVSAQEGLLHATGCSEQDELSRLSFVWKHLQLWGVEGGGGGAQDQNSPGFAAPPVCACKCSGPCWERPSSSLMCPLSHSPPCCHPPGSAERPSPTSELKSNRGEEGSTPPTFKDPQSFSFYYYTVWRLWIREVICGRRIYSRRCDCYELMRL